MTNTTPDELLPCPFCGHEPSYHTDNEGITWVCCGRLPEELCDAGNHNMRAEHWNTRQQQAQVGKVVYKAIEIYDTEIRYDGKQIYYGNVKGKTQKEIDDIIRPHLAPKREATIIREEIAEAIRQNVFIPWAGLVCDVNSAADAVLELIRGKVS